MIPKGSKVRHTDPEIDDVRGVMIVFAIAHGFALCGYPDRLGKELENYAITDLVLIS
ncbi:hypothetical protein [Chitinophaga pinensis]|uniref:Uncharacterized protein n=1 Tax=Chitinophaga pinensis (strain ATCC 43595 / DSM 2588 / LMG 13176 / NBRC 15968 / NCIMB 11800 / UQM 2034) TaxID=485918 RepID=A0A979G8G9_CHIPD|nr:hypothetical protein [Chitinophaga pinensis]ACU62573.1 hypothetical protein Cpin_5141 [Chitinophaga pinensis DSM 2588]